MLRLFPHKRAALVLGVVTGIGFPGCDRAQFDGPLAAEPTREVGTSGGEASAAAATRGADDEPTVSTTGLGLTDESDESDESDGSTGSGSTGSGTAGDEVPDEPEAPACFSGTSPEASLSYFDALHGVWANFQVPEPVAPCSVGEVTALAGSTRAQIDCVNATYRIEADVEGLAVETGAPVSLNVRQGWFEEPSFFSVLEACEDADCPRLVLAVHRPGQGPIRPSSDSPDLPNAELGWFTLSAASSGCTTQCRDYLTVIVSSDADAVALSSGQIVDDAFDGWYSIAVGEAFVQDFDACGGPCNVCGSVSARIARVWN